MKEKQRVIALGFFDGVHIGHGALLRRTADRAKEKGLLPAVVTFDTPPKNLVMGKPVLLIDSPYDRAWIMRENYGIKDVIFAHFDKRMMCMPWQDFVTDFLVRDCRAAHLVAGHDFHFGYKGEGDPERLREICGALSLGCDIIPKVEKDGITVSSTYIRELIAKGEIARANAFLGHPHVLSGIVNHGRRVGRTLGFPTVNLALPEGVLTPRFGVYVTRVTLPDGRSYPCVTNIGIRPTVDDSERVSVEGYLIGFSGDLYGETVRMEFFDYLRPERKFSSPAALTAEIEKNARQVEDYFRPRGTGQND
ncbi:MAG TPA: riboflavin biosynthesis protein RibF [Oscillospiraceae bacterium]|nr:riboflavin biosynthesis protein RibF [Oscillospiraceae bacterium]